MKLIDIFGSENIFKGLRLEVDNSEKEIEYYLVDTKDVNKCVINYTNSGLHKVKMRVNDKYFLKSGDIIIASIPSSTSCHVGYCHSFDDKIKAIIKKNFFILRNPINNNYNLEFIAEYLENIGIKELGCLSLTKQDIENINIPNISRDVQDELIDIINPINEKCKLYNRLIDNEYLIKGYLLEEVINNEK